MTRLIPPALLVVALAASSLAAAVEWPSRNPPAAERGKELYERLCVSCHGARGAGDGPLATALTVKVPDFTEGYGDRDVPAMIAAVKLGKGAMPSFENALMDYKPYSGDTKEFAKAVVDYLGKLGSSPVEPPPAPPLSEDADEEGDAP